MGKDFNVSLYFLSCLQTVTLGFLFVTTVTKALTTNPIPLLSVTKGHTEKLAERNFTSATHSLSLIHI